MSDPCTVTDRMNRLRAGVLGANDGIVSVSATIIGVAAAHAGRTALLAAALAALLAGAVSMGLGEYVSVATQRDAERPLVTAGQMEPAELVQPWSAAASSSISFTLGALLPVVAMLACAPTVRIPVTFGAVVVALLVTGFTSARLGRTPCLRPVTRVVLGGATAMAVTYLVGYLL